MKKADVESIPQMAAIQKKLHALSKSIADLDNYLHYERLEFVHVEKKWKDFSESLDRDD